jgi:hypothetical protein
MRRIEFLLGQSRISHFAVAALLSLGVASAAKAVVLLGGFQGASDPTDAGWTDLQNSDPITTDPLSSFPAAGVPGYAQSLQIVNQGLAPGFGNPASLQIQLNPTQVAALNANSYLTFTFSTLTGSATGGYNQIYNLVFNAPGYGYNNFMSGSSAATTWGVYSQSESIAGVGNSQNQSGEPNFYMYAGDPSLDSETVTVNYSSILPAIIAGGESYVQIDWQGNTGGGAAGNEIFNNVVLSTAPFGVDAVPEPVSASLIGVASLGLLARRRRTMGS